MKKFKKSKTIILSIVLMFVPFIQSVKADTVVDYNDLRLSSSSIEKEINLDNHIDEFLKSEKGSVSIRFKPDKDNGALSSLLSLSDRNLQNNYFALYYRDGSVGIEFRDKAGNHIINKQEGFERLSGSTWHTITLTYEGNNYKVYGDGQLLFEENINIIKELNKFNINTMRVGQLTRSNGDNQWPFKGLIEHFTIDKNVYSKEEIEELHKITAYDELPILGESTEIFVPGQEGSNAYRIPSMMVSNEDTVFAAIDKRNQHSADWGNIDIALRRSFDHGETWEKDQVIIDLKENPNVSGNQHSAFLIDAAMVQDDNTGRIFMLVDMFPESTGFGSVGSDVNTFGQPYVEVDGEKYLNLRSEDGTFYYAKEDGTIYKKETNEKTDMHVVLTSEEQPFNDLGDLYDGDEYIGNIYHKYTATPIRAMATAYLWLTYSDDDGATWSSPVDITPEVKQDWMHFIGTGPGAGLQVDNGDLVFPIYSTNKHGGNSQSSALIGSSDGGDTWEYYESVNDNRVVNGQTINAETLNNFSHVTTESQVVQLDSGDLKLFMRNATGKVLVATSKDRGKTWENKLESLPITEVYVQLSALQVHRDGKEYVLISSAAGPDRANGTVKVLEVQENDHLELLHETSIQQGPFAYNTLVELGDGHLGVFYEHHSAKFNGDMAMLFKKFPFEKLGEKQKIDFELVEENKLVTIKSNYPLLASSTLSLQYNDGKIVKAKQVKPKEVIFELEESLETLEGFNDGYLEGVHGERLFAYNENYVTTLFDRFEKMDEGQFASSIYEQFEKISNDFAKHDKNPLTLYEIVERLEVLLSEDSLTEITDDYFNVKASSEQLIVDENQPDGTIDYAFDKNPETFWHTRNGVHDETYTVTFDFLEPVELKKMKYLPRQDGKLMSIVSDYELYAYVDGERIKVGGGSWDINSDMKEAILDEPVVTEKFEFVVIGSHSNTAGAAEITLHGALKSSAETDKSELKELVNKTKVYDKKDYTEESWTLFAEKLIIAEEVLNQTGATQAEVDQTIADLQSAIDQLVEITDEDPIESVKDIKDLAEKLVAAGAFADEKEGRLVVTHLTALEHYEKQGDEKKVIKHLENLFKLLDHQIEQGLISNDAYEELTDSMEKLLK